MQHIIEASVPIFMALGVFTMIVLLRRMENQEKLRMIEKGMDISKYVRPKSPNTGIATKLALMAMGIGLGLLIGNILDTYTGLNEEVCYFSMVFLFGGAGLFGGNKLVEKKKANNN